MKALRIAVLAVVMGSLEGFAELPPELTPARLEGAWIGHDRAAVNLVRIVFEAGSGALTLDRGFDRVALPMRWNLTESGVVCDFPSAAEAAIQIRVLEASSVLLRVQLIESRRKRTFDLFREDRFLKRLERMRAVSKDQETSSTARSGRARLDPLTDGSGSTNTEDLRQNTAAATAAAAEIARKHMEEAGWEEIKVDSVEFLTNHWSVRLSRVPYVFGGHATVKISTNRTNPGGYSRAVNAIENLF